MRSVGCCHVQSAANAPLLVVATLYQGSNWYVISHKDKPIRTALDMKGKKMGVVSVNGTTENFLDLMLTSAGVKPWPPSA